MVSFDVSLNFANASNKVTRRKERRGYAYLMSLVLVLTPSLTHCLCLRLQVPIKAPKHGSSYGSPPALLLHTNDLPPLLTPGTSGLPHVFGLSQINKCHTHIPLPPASSNWAMLLMPFILAQAKPPWKRKGLVHNSQTRLHNRLETESSL